MKPTLSAARDLVARYPLTAFMVGAMTTQIVLTASQYYEVRNFGLAYLRIPSPALWGVAVAWIAWGRRRALDLVGSLLKLRVPPKFYAMALLYPPGVALVSLGILRVVGLNHEIEFDFREPSRAEFAWLSFQISVAEEVAWVGFVLAALAHRYRLFQASVATGVLWGVWYIPLVLADIQVTPGLPVFPLLINFASIAAICAWLYLRTQSAAVVAIMQITTNYTTQLIPVLPQRGGLTQYVAFVLVKSVFSVALFALWGPKPLFGKNATGRSSLERSVVR